MDYSGLCLCCPSSFEGMEEQNLIHEEDADYLSFPKECKNLPTYLNTKEKWMETVLQSNCTHRWLYLMEGIFRSNIDACSERLIITYLTNDLIDIYTCDEFDNDHEFEFWIILHGEEGWGEENIVNIMVNHIYLILQGKIYLRVVVYLLFFQHQKDGLK